MVSEPASTRPIWDRTSKSTYATRYEGLQLIVYAIKQETLGIGKTWGWTAFIGNTLDIAHSGSCYALNCALRCSERAATPGRS